MRLGITKDKLEAMLRAAYEDGFDDGSYAEAGGTISDTQWNETVTKDNFDQDVDRARNTGGWLG